MKGIDFLVDTNFLIHISLNSDLVTPFFDYSYGISYITEIELLGVFSINKENKKNAQNLINNCFIPYVTKIRIPIHCEYSNMIRWFNTFDL